MSLPNLLSAEDQRLKQAVSPKTPASSRRSYALTPPREPW